MDRIQIKEWSREKLKGNLASILGAMILVGIIFGIISAVDYLLTEVLYPNRAFLRMALSVLSALISLALIPLQIGLSRFLLNKVDGNETGFKVLFEDYRSGKRIAEELKAFILMSVYIMIGFILLIIPGIVLALKYSQLSNVFADDPDIKYNEAMKRCGRLMEGRKVEFFIFELSFIAWALLVLITFGIAALYVGPYMSLAAAKWYREKCLADNPPAPVIEIQPDDFYRNL